MWALFLSHGYEQTQFVKLPLSAAVRWVVYGSIGAVGAEGSLSVAIGF